MKTGTSLENFDCVRYMREARDRISVETANMGPEDLMRWLRSYRYSDPLLEKLAAHRCEPTGRPSDESAS